MRLALDTNRYVDFARGVEDATHALARAREIYVPFVVLAELRAGFQGGSRGPENERRLVQFLNTPRVTILYPDEATTPVRPPLHATAAPGHPHSHE